MLKRWLLPGALALVLLLLGLLAPWWWPRLLSLAGTHSARIEGLAGLVQIVLWLGAAAVFVVRLWLSRNAPKVEPEARPSLAGGQVAVEGTVGRDVIATSIGHLEVNVQAPDAADFLRRFLKLLALALASGQGETLGLGGRLPILLPLAAYANALADRDVSLDAFIARYYEEERKIQVPLGALDRAVPPQVDGIH